MNTILHWKAHQDILDLGLESKSMRSIVNVTDSFPLIALVTKISNYKTQKLKYFLSKTINKT